MVHIWVEIYDSQISRWLFPEEKKGWSKWTREKLVYMDQQNFNLSKTTQKKKKLWRGLTAKGIWYSPAKQDKRIS